MFSDLQTGTPVGLSCEGCDTRGCHLAAASGWIQPPNRKEGCKETTSPAYPQFLSMYSQANLRPLTGVRTKGTNHVGTNYFGPLSSIKFRDEHYPVLLASISFRNYIEYIFEYF